MAFFWGQQVFEGEPNRAGHCIPFPTWALRMMLWPSRVAMAARPVLLSFSVSLMAAGEFCGLGSCVFLPK